jgi:hypothetical protein
MSKQSALVWKRNNPDKAKANHKAWRDANKQKLAQWDAAYRSTPEGKEKARLRQQKYREENRERVRELERARRAATSATPKDGGPMGASNAACQIRPDHALMFAKAAAGVTANTGCTWTIATKAGSSGVGYAGAVTVVLVSLETTLKALSDCLPT